MNLSFDAQRRIQLVFGFIMMLFTGVSYAWSLFVDTLQQDMGWAADQTSLVFTISVVVLCTGSMLGSLLDRKFGLRKTFLIGTICIAIGLIGCSLSTEIWHMYIFYGVLAGFAVGLFYNNETTTVGSWYPDRVGFVSGCMLMGFGMGALVLGPVISALIPQVGWRWTFFILGIAFTAMGIAAIFIVKKSPVESGNDPETVAADVEQLLPSQIIRRANYWVFVLWAMFIGGVGVGVIGHASTIASAMNADPASVVLATGLTSLTNGVSRIGWGALYDRFRIEGVAVVVTLVLTLGLALVWLALQSGLVPLLLAAGMCVGAGYGGVFPGAAAFVRQKFGIVNYKQNFGVANCCIGPYAFGAYILGLLLVALGSYLKAIPYLFIIVFIGAAFLIPANLMARKSARDRKPVLIAQQCVELS